MSSRISITFLFAAVVAAFYSCVGLPNMGGDGQPCNSAGVCMPGYECRDNVCVKSSGDEDAGGDGKDGGSDSGIGDGGSIYCENTLEPKVNCTDKGGNLGWMCEVPEGCFMMGCDLSIGNGCSQYEMPFHKVYLNKYLIDQYQVTMGDFQKCVDAGVCSHHWDDYACRVSGNVYVCTIEDPGILRAELRGANKPAVCIDWNQAKIYCEWAGKRLPTEAEWEKAARGVDGRRYPWGNNPSPSCEYAVIMDENIGVCGCNTVSTLDVGSKPKGVSPYGVDDMIGNAVQWTADWFGESYYSESPYLNPKGPGSGSAHSCRGAFGWKSTQSPYQYVSFRYPWTTDLITDWVGFRCAMDFK